MPRYDCLCTKCGRYEERDAPIAERDFIACRCNYIMVRLPSAPGFTLKGKGFHCNDYPKR